MTTSCQYCMFDLNGSCYGIDVLKVQEVIRHQPTRRVPLAPSAVSGLINLRGQIVTAIDLRRRLGMPDRPADQPPMQIVVRADGEAVSLLVDAIHDVQDVRQDAYEQPPETLDAELRRLILGVYKLDERLLLVLDTEQAINLH